MQHTSMFAVEYPFKAGLFILPTLHFPQQSHDLAFSPMNLRRWNKMFVQLRIQRKECCLSAKLPWAKKFPTKDDFWMAQMDKVK